MSFYHAPTFLRTSIARNPFCHGGLIQPEDILRFEAEFPTLFDLPAPPTPKESPRSDNDEDIRGKTEKAVTSKASTPTRRKQSSTVGTEQKGRIRKREPTPTNTPRSVPRKREERPCGISQFHKHCFQNQEAAKKEVKRNVKTVSPKKDSTSIPLKKKTSGLLQRPAQSFSLENLRETLKQVLEEDFYQHKPKFEKSKSPYTEDLVKKFFGRKLQEINEQKAANHKRNVPKRVEIARNDENSDISEVAIWLDSPPQHKKKLGTRLDQTDSKRQSPLQEKVEKVHVVKSAPGFLRGPPTLPPAPSLNYLKRAQKSVRKQVPLQKEAKHVTWEEESERGDGDASRALQPKASNPDGFRTPRNSRSKIVGDCICGRKIKASRAKSAHVENEESESVKDERHSKRRTTKNRHTSRNRSLSRSGGFLQDCRFPCNSRYHIPLPTSVKGYVNATGGLRNYDAPTCIKPPIKKSEEKQKDENHVRSHKKEKNEKHTRSHKKAENRPAVISASSTGSLGHTSDDGLGNVTGDLRNFYVSSYVQAPMKERMVKRKDENHVRSQRSDMKQENRPAKSRPANNEIDLEETAVSTSGQGSPTPSHTSVDGLSTDVDENLTEGSRNFEAPSCVQTPRKESEEKEKDKNKNDVKSDEKEKDESHVKSDKNQENQAKSRSASDKIDLEKAAVVPASPQGSPGHTSIDGLSLSMDIDENVTGKSWDFDAPICVQPPLEESEEKGKDENHVRSDKKQKTRSKTRSSNDKIDLRETALVSASSQGSPSPSHASIDILNMDVENNGDHKMAIANRTSEHKSEQQISTEDRDVDNGKLISKKSDDNDNSKYSEDFIQDVISVKSQSNQSNQGDNYNDNSKYSEDFIQEDAISVKSQSNHDGNDNSKCSGDFIQEAVISVKSQSNKDGNDNSKYAEDFIQEDAISVKSQSNHDGNDNSKCSGDFIQEAVNSVKSQSNQDGNDSSKYAEDFIQDDVMSVKSQSNQDGNDIDKSKYAEDFIQEEDVISVKSQSNQLRTPTPPIRDMQNLSLEEDHDDLSSSRETVMDLVSEGELLEVEAVPRSPGEVSSSEEVHLESIRSPGEVTDSARFQHSLSNSTTRSSTSGSALQNSGRCFKISPIHSKKQAFNAKLSDGENSGISFSSEGLVANSSPGNIMSVGERS